MFDDPCEEWQGARTKQGYGVTWYRGKWFLAHRAEWIKANGDIPAGMVVMHKCNNPPCHKLAHLKLGTHHDNSMHMVESGRSRGGRPKTLSPELEVRILTEPGSQAEVARRLGVSQATVSRLRGGRKEKGRICQLPTTSSRI